MSSSDYHGNADTNGDGDSIKVFLRVRPPEEADGLVNYGQCLEVQKPDTVILKTKKEKKVFTYDHVAGQDITQEEVFSAVGKKTIESCVAGYNGTIFAYGQTGSGKTFTMIGPSEEGDNFHHQLRGVIPRSFEYLFNLVNREREKQGDRFSFLIRCSFLEIYNEQIFDLLDSTSKGLNLRENMKKGVYVDGLQEQTVNSPHEAYNVLTAGWINRKVASTSMNRESSRSHAVFTVSIETKENKAGVSNVRVSQLHLVDLAGSERQKDTKAAGARLKEAGNINKSLSTLGNVIMALVDIANGKQRFVPYRNSKLSFLLRDSLGGNSKTFIVANVHPGARCFGETLSTLNFARRAKMIKNKAVVNEDTQGNVTLLQAEIKRLKEQLSQYQGSVPRPLGPPGSEHMAGDSAASSADQGARVVPEEFRKYKRQFYIAMSTKEEGMKGLSERVSELEHLCRKKDQYVQSSKMVLRLRQNHISHLEKNMPVIDPSKREKLLQEEIKAIKEQLDHHPDVLRYAIENKKLRQEIQKLKSMAAVQAGLDFTAQQRADLDQAYQALKESKDETGRIRFGSTPSSTPVMTPIPPATLEKHQAQLKTIQAQLDSARQEAAEQKEVFHRRQIELEAELEASKKSLRETETALEGMKAKNRLDRDAMNDMHMQTIKTITTPKKKSGYQLRSRVITFSSSTPITPRVEGASLETTPPRPGSEMGIIEEEIPDHVMEQCTEALTAELKSYGAKNNNLQTQLDESAAHVLKLTQQVSKLEYQSQQENELWAKEKALNETLRKQAEQLRKELADLKTKYEITHSEAEDFRLMLQSVDKQHTEKAAKDHVREQEMETNVSQLQNKLVQIENLASVLQTARDTLDNEKVHLEERNMTLEAELSFMDEQRKDLEDRLRTEMAAKKDMHDEIGSMLERLDSECEKNNRLTQELKEGSDSTQRLGEVNDQISQENKELRAALAGKESDVNRLTRELQDLNASKAASEAELNETKGTMNQLVSNLHDLTAKLDSKSEEVMTLTEQLTSAEQEREEVLIALNEAQANWEAMEVDSHSSTMKYQDKITSLQEELKELSSTHANFLVEMGKQEFLLMNSRADCEDLTDCIQTLEKEVEDKNAAIKAFEQQLAETAANISTVMVESVPSPEVQQKMEELESLRMTQEKMAEITERYQKTQNELEVMREEKNEEISSLKEKLKDVDRLREEKGQLEEIKEQLRRSMEEASRAANNREDALKAILSSLENELTRVKNATQGTDQLKEDHNMLTEKFKRLEGHVSVLQKDNSQLQTEMTRVSSLEKAQFEEKEELRSRLEVVMEEKSKQTEAYSRLEKKFEEVSTENAKLVGHQNFKQKIQYHQRIKMENNELREELKKAHKETFAFKQELEVARKKLEHLPATKNKELAALHPAKENIGPTT